MESDGLADLDSIFLTTAQMQAGFRERAQLPERDGRIGHTEMEIDHGVVMVASGLAGYTKGDEQFFDSQ